MEIAKAAIECVFSDTSVPRETTRESLEELRDQINEYFDNLDEDDRRDREE